MRAYTLVEIDLLRTYLARRNKEDFSEEQLRTAMFAEVDPKEAENYFVQEVLKLEKEWQEKEQSAIWDSFYKKSISNIQKLLDNYRKGIAL